jgi:hypothetical protein
MRTRIELAKSALGSTKTFEVYNSAHGSLLVLAEDSETARSIAWSAAHIYHTDNGLKGEDRNVHEVKTPSAGISFDHWALVQKAASEGRQGTIMVVDGRILIGDSELM